MEYQYAKLSKFPDNEGDYVFLNERITRVGALQCLCKQESSSDKTFDITLPDGSLTQEVLCPTQKTFLGFVSLTYIHSQLYSLTLVGYSLLYRTIYSIFVSKVRLTSKTSETLMITAMICIIYTLNYGYTYLSGPIFYQSDETKAQNKAFIPYGD